MRELGTGSRATGDLDTEVTVGWSPEEAQLLVLEQ
jgi:putative spermidine/putrescine transport system ATP-binding protein